jgi:virginiamycin B lyase
MSKVGEAGGSMASLMSSSQTPAIALMAMLVLSQQDVPDLPRPTPVPAGVRLSITRITPDAKIPLPGAPADMTMDAGVWVANRATREIARIDPKTNAVTGATSAAAAPCAGIAADFGGIWAPACGPGALVRVDAKTQKVAATVTTSVLDGASSVATGVGSVWLLADAAGTLLRLDPDTNAPVAEISLPAGVNALAFGEGAVWIAIGRTSQVARIDPHTNVVTKLFKVGRAPSALAVGEGGVWVLNQGDGTISRIDPKTDAVVATIASGVATTGGRMVAGEGALWITAPGLPLVRIDPATNRVTQQFAGEGGGAIAIGHGSLWLANTKAGSIWRIDPKLVAALVP